jgi:hypothetical protein
MMAERVIRLLLKNHSSSADKRFLLGNKDRRIAEMEFAIKEKCGLRQLKSVFPF